MTALLASRAMQLRVQNMVRQPNCTQSLRHLSLLVRRSLCLRSALKRKRVALRASLQLTHLRHRCRILMSRVARVLLSLTRCLWNQRATRTTQRSS